jgi:phage gpG-like protein
MTPKEFQKRLNTLEKEFKELFSRYAPTIAGKTAVSLFKKNFQEEGFFGDRWREVKRRQDNKGSKKAWARRKILTGATGDLGRSIHYRVQKDGKAIIFTEPSDFTHSKEPYGRVHNEGLRAGRGSGFTMPKRQFIGDHPELRQAIADEINRKLKEIALKQ